MVRGIGASDPSSGGAGGWAGATPRPRQITARAPRLTIFRFMASLAKTGPPLKEKSPAHAGTGGRSTSPLCERPPDATARHHSLLSAKTLTELRVKSAGGVLPISGSLSSPQVPQTASRCRSPRLLPSLNPHRRNRNNRNAIAASPAPSFREANRVPDSSTPLPVHRTPLSPAGRRWARRGAPPPKGLHRPVQRQGS